MKPRGINQQTFLTDADRVPMESFSETLMEQKTCDACGCPFTPRPQAPHQTYCTHPECQRERRRRWQQQKRQGDSDYRDNDIRNSRTWASENPQYWKQYRDENPDYVGRNRNLQQQRNQKQRSVLIAKEDVSNPVSPLPSGRYQMARILADGTIGGQTWIVEITPLRMQMNSEDV